MKNTHMYNPYNFQLEIPSKMLYKIKSKPGVKESGKEAEIVKQKQLKKIEKAAKEQVKILTEADDFKQFNEAFPAKAKVMAAEFAKWFGKGGKIEMMHTKLNQSSNFFKKLSTWDIVVEKKIIDELKVALTIALEKMEDYMAKKKAADVFYGTSDSSGEYLNRLLRYADEKVVAKGVAGDFSTVMREYVLEHAPRVVDPAASKLALIAAIGSKKNEVPPFVKYKGKYNVTYIHDIVHNKMQAMRDKIDQYAAERLDKVKRMPDDIDGTYYMEGKANKENEATRIKTEAYVLANIVPVLKNNGVVVVDIVGRTSAEGNANYNKTLQKKRAAAQKAAIVRALDKLLPKWKTKGEVKWNITYESVAPKMKVKDLHTDLRSFVKGLNQSIPAVRKIVAKIPGIGPLLSKHMKGKKIDLKGLIKAIDTDPKLSAEKKLLTYITILSYGSLDPKAVVREYNVYTDYLVKEGQQVAKTYLKGTKYLNKNRWLMRYLHTYLGKARSSEYEATRVVAPESGPEFRDLLTERPRNIFDEAEEAKEESLANLTDKLSKKYKDSYVSVEKGVIIVREITSGGQSLEGKILAKLKPNADGSKYVAYDAEGKRKGEYSVAQIEGGKMDSMLA